MGGVLGANGGALGYALDRIFDSDYLERIGIDDPVDLKDLAAAALSGGLGAVPFPGSFPAGPAINIINEQRKGENEDK